MDEPTLRLLLEDLQSGAIGPDEVLRRLRRLPYADLGFARVDHHRALRQGRAETVYAPGKSPEQCAAIVAELLSEPGGAVLLSRADPLQVDSALTRNPSGRVTWSDPTARRLATVAWRSLPQRSGRVVVITAGTADLSVATECTATLQAHGLCPSLLADCGVAGVHRLLAVADELMAADAVVVVAGMEGALASLVAGLTPAPVVAVPTSVGYGAALEGVTALLAMLASCAAGLTVVGIDNGFGAASAVMRLLARVEGGRVGALTGPDDGRVDEGRATTAEQGGECRR